MRERTFLSGCCVWLSLSLCGTPTCFSRRRQVTPVPQVPVCSRDPARVFWVPVSSAGRSERFRPFPLETVSPSSASGTQAASARPSPSTSCPCLRHSTVAALWTGCWVMAACWQGHCPSLLCPGQCHRARLMWGSRLTPRRCSPRPHPLCLFRAPGSAAYLEFITSLHSVKLSAATSRCVQAPCLQPRLRDLTSG